MKKTILIQGDYGYNLFERVVEELSFQGLDVEPVVLPSVKEYTFSGCLRHIADFIEIALTNSEENRATIINGFFTNVPPVVWENYLFFETVTGLVKGLGIKVDHLFRIFTQPVEIVEGSSYDIFLDVLCKKKNQHFCDATKMSENELFEKMVLTLKGWLT